MQPLKPQKPLTDLQIWGEPEPKAEIVCPLKINNQCPEGCCECDRFTHELIYGPLGGQEHNLLNIKNV